VLHDVVLRICSNRDLVPTNRDGVEPRVALACATRNSSAGADRSTPGALDINGATARSIIAAVFQRTAAAIAAVGLSYSNYQPQSGRQRRHRVRAVALGPAFDRPLSADSCAGQAPAAGSSTQSSTGSAFMA